MISRGGGGGSKGPSALLIIGLICCFCIILPLIIYGSLWGTNTICDKTNPADQPWLGMNCASVYEGSTTPATTTRTPATTSGTPAPGPSGPPPPINLQTAELTLTASNPDVAATTQPTVSASSNVVFTISMDINLDSAQGGWREIFQNYTGDSWINNTAAPAGNTPLISIFPSSTGADVNKVLFRMMLDNDTQWMEAITTTALVPGTYAKFTAVCNDTKITLYINGTKSGEATAPAGRKMKWRSTNNFAWNPTSYQGWGTIKVKNGKWWNRALTASEVTALGTSTYMPQPISMGTSAYVKETYMPY